MKRVGFKRLSRAFVVALACGLSVNALAASFELAISILGPSGVSQWDPEKASKLGQKKIREKDPVTKSSKTWSGVGLKALVDETAGKLPAEQNAEIDLIVVEDAAGKRAMIPRSFVNKYTVVLSLSDSKENWDLIAPWSSDKKALKERLPLETFHIQNVKRVTLTNYRNLYGAGLFLKRRTDPLAVRGEKIFVQTCMGCHFQNAVAKPDEMASKVREHKFGENSHLPVGGFPDLHETDWRSLQTYVKASQSEAAAAAAAETKKKSGFSFFN